MTDSELKKYAKKNKLDSASVLAGYNLARDEVKQVILAGENTETGELLRAVGLDILPVDLEKENKDFAEWPILLNLAKDKEAMQAFMNALKRLQVQ